MELLDFQMISIIIALILVVIGLLVHCSRPQADTGAGLVWIGLITLILSPLLL